MTRLGGPSSHEPALPYGKMPDMKNRRGWFLAFTVALLLVGLVRAQRTAVAKQTWEYKLIGRQRDIEVEQSADSEPTPGHRSL